ncbi:MAG: ATP-binding protein [Candidatus Binatia bacterium]
MRILIVEDHASSRKLLRAQLEAEGIEVVETTDGLEALEALRTTAVDVVVSDILMPNLDGFRLCHEVRNDPALAHLPFLLYTSTYNSPADRQLAETVGVDCFVTKPAPLPVLLQAIEEARTRPHEQHAVPLSEHDENYVLKRYSEALVRKLEEKNAELESALSEIQHSHQAILDLNIELESRVQRRTQQLEEANRELEAFTYSVSHDLRAPLRRIDGFARLLEAATGNTLDEDGRKAMDIILKSTKEMSGLIGDLLAFSRSARSPLQREVVDLDALVDDVVASTALDVGSRRIEWERGQLPRVWGDPSLLKQVFANLVDNAVKYTRPRDPALIRIAHEGKEGSLAVIRVQDNGVGFDPEQTDKVFGVFQRLHRPDEFEGSGIGLAIVEKIVHRHSGRIWAESVPGSGSSFFLTLPPAPAEA